MDYDEVRELFENTVLNVIVKPVWYGVVTYTVFKILDSLLSYF